MIEVTNEQQAELLARQLLNIGEAMYRAGAEISRIEDSLHRLGKAYGAAHVSVYAITSDIIITAEFGADHSITQSRRIRGRSSVDCARLAELNQLCRSCAAEPMSIAELKEAVAGILERKPSEWAVNLGQIIAAASFTVFFGGNLSDAAVAALGVLLICWMQKRFRPIFTAELFFNLAASFATGVCVSLLNRCVAGLHVDQILIGDIMVLIPGIAITNSIRYILSGDMISSFEKLMDSLLQAFGIAAGFTLALHLVGGEILEAAVVRGTPAWAAVQLATASLGTVGFCLVFNMKKEHILIPTIGGCICWAVYLLMQGLGCPIFLSALTSAVVVGAYGELFARVIRVPTTILFIPACVPLIPGGNLYYSTRAILASDWSSFRENAVLLALYAVGIALGLAFVVELERIWLRLHKPVSAGADIQK